MIATADYDLLTTAAGLVDRSARGKLVVRGAEAADFLQGQVTNDVERLSPGEGCYAAILTHKGKFRTDMRILRTDDGFWIDTEPIGLVPARWTVETYAIGRAVEHEDVTERMVILSLVGPAARDALDAAPPATEHAHVSGEHGRYVATHLGVDVICEADDAAGVRETLGVPEVDEAVAECLRIESGRPRLGYDMDGDTIPQEAGVNERAVDFEKGCYVGQETVARLHWRGKPNRHLRGLRLSEEVERGTELRLGEKPVGRVGSVSVSPLHGPIALALVRREAGPGDELAAGDEGATATVVDPPFVSG
ncbi:MAG: glycine cleavage T C-terminal barrel domain-containing protein [Thermoleophilaceae bacterium]